VSPPRNPRRRTWALLAVALAVPLVVIVRSGSAAPEVVLPPERGDAPVTAPKPVGIPTVVRVGVRFVDVTGVDENAGTFSATVDLRLRWKGSAPQTTPAPRTGVFRGEAAIDQALSTVWHPTIVLSNLDGDPAYRERGLEIDADGHVELIERTQGTFSSPFQVVDFPFDRHPLQVAVAVREATIGEVLLDFTQDDVAYSRVDPGVEIDGWRPKVVDFTRAPLRGLRDDYHSRVVAGLWVERDWRSVLAPVFIPLFSALLIPLLAIWLNKAEEGGFAVDAFELANILIGGLFAVIALNFTINAEYRTVASGDNTVTRLFGLNYLTLAISLLVVITLFRFNLARRFFGRWIQDQVFTALMWVIPAIALATAAAFLTVAAMG
jgi:hypothetical protein